MILVRTERFKKAYRYMASEIQQRIKEKLLLLESNPRHPSLQVKKIQGISNIYEARISLNYRVTFQISGNEMILRNIGPHDSTLKSP